MRTFIFFLVIVFIPIDTNAHSGGVNSDGCHNKSADNTYHCHDKRGGLGGLYFFISILLIYYSYKYLEYKLSDANKKSNTKAKEEKQRMKMNDHSGVTDYDRANNRNEIPKHQNLLKDNNAYSQDQTTFRRSIVQRKLKISSTTKEHKADQLTENKTNEKLIKEALKATGLDIKTLATIIKCYIETIESKNKRREEKRSPSKKDVNQK